jgi:hypothetical protein
MFDFTSLFHAVNASRIVERNGKRLLMALVGDSLLEVNQIDLFLYIDHAVRFFSRVFGQQVPVLV